MIILKNATCPKLRGKGVLNYQIECADMFKVMLRVKGNSLTGGGYFSNECLSLNDIEEVLSKSDSPIFTCKVLSPLFQGRSTNNAGFLMAVLLNEGLVKRSKQHSQYFEIGDRKALMESLSELRAAQTPVPAFTHKDPQQIAG